MRTLLIGGARSGKSALAARWANERSMRVCALVTGMESDPEMAARIAAHRRERPAHWRVREEAVHLGLALREEGATHGPAVNPELRAPAEVAATRELDVIRPLLLVDCLTLWISNCLWPDDAVWPRERPDFLDALSVCTADVIVVTNEVGTGIVPNNASARIFRDEQGWLNQAVAAVCDEVYFVTAGLPFRLKPV